jgi:DNA-binding NtrC family response regulator
VTGGKRAVEKILIVEDDYILREQMALFFRRSYQILEASTRREAMEIVRTESPALAMVDLHLPPNADVPAEGMGLISWIRAYRPDLSILVISGSDEKMLALEAIEKGAYDYFQKPIDLKEMEIIVGRALKRRSIELENERLKKKLGESCGFERIIGNSREIRRVVELARNIADSDASVLITGASGTGKELVAQAIHQASRRSEAELVVLNCAAIPQDLVESELFGYERGAFTGAVASKPGKIERADGGTLFLDEIGDLQLSAQAKLLRVIEEKKFERLGGTRLFESDFRLIVATNQDLRAKISEATFREDLYFRVNVVEISLPVLGERKSDIPLLAQHFVGLYAGRAGKGVSGLTEEAMERLMQYDFPGNVRELENIVERAVALARDDTITVKELPEVLQQDMKKGPVPVGLEELTGNVSLPQFLEEVECRILREALAAASHRKREAAQILGINNERVKYLCRKYGIR